jgi:3-methyladenine DNA glycosylase Tag
VTGQGARGPAGLSERLHISLTGEVQNANTTHNRVVGGSNPPAATSPNPDRHCEEAMEEHKQPSPAETPSGYLEALAQVMFQAGISWRVVNAKWPDIRAAFHNFDPERVASLTTADIDNLMDDPRVIRNRRKLEAVVANARVMLALDGEYGGFDRYLDSLGDFDSTKKELIQRFAFLGDAGAWFFLWTVGRRSRPTSAPRADSVGAASRVRRRRALDDGTAWNLVATPRPAGATAWILYSATAELPVLREGCVCPGRLGGRDRVRSG